MELHRDVIVDLLPVYFAGEASDETRRLVESRVAGDPELARLVEKGREDLASMIPPPVTHKENPTMELEAVKRLALIRTLGLSVVISGSFIALVALAIGAVFMLRGR